VILGVLLSVLLSLVFVGGLVWWVRPLTKRHRPQFEAVEYHSVGPVSGFNVGRLTREYLTREDMTCTDFEARLDEHLRMQPWYQPYNDRLAEIEQEADDREVILASAAVCGQTYEQVLGAYAERLRFAGVRDPSVVETR
jgi:hypothetical protein